MGDMMTAEGIGKAFLVLLILVLILKFMFDE